MFLVVFVTLVISIIGLYAQVLSVQTAKLAKLQYGLAQTMLAWHGTATTLARTIPSTSLSTSGCSLTTPTCPTASVTASGLLPPGYRVPPASSYIFNSVAFQSLSPIGSYVVTYVHDTDPTTGTLILPGTGGSTIGIKPTDLQHQLINAAPAYIAYGSVTSSGVLTLYTISNSTGSAPQLTYSIPLSIPVGSIAVLSAAQ